MNGLSMMPAVSVEFLGSALVIILAFIALTYSWSLIKLQPNNFIWGFLWYFSIAMAAFSISRGVGHILRVALAYTGYADTWAKLSPYSGGFNTMLMISVAAVTIYYHKGLDAYKAIRSKADKLAEVAAQLQTLNLDLETMVDERTRDLSFSERKFRNFFENSKDMVYFSDVAGTITTINNSGKELLGLEESTGPINFHELFRDSAVLEEYVSGLRTNGFVSDLEIECVGRDGAPCLLLLSANTSYGPDGSVTGFEGIGKDMTRIRTMTEQLINHEKMASVGQMAAGVAHEINTPMGIILGYTQLMMDDVDPDSEFFANMQVIERQIKACRRIVGDLLKFSRQEESHKVSLDANEVIQEVLAVTEHTLNINGIEVKRHFDDQLPQVIGDADKLRQVIINLINNAQYAMQNGGIITIRTSHEAGHILITVTDSGTGIGDDIKSRIFDPFFTTKEVGKGTGLGLSVTYGIVKEHGGTVSAESPVVLPTGEQRQGASFIIRLPVHDAADIQSNSPPEN